jgi:hypothetical protein
MNVAGIVCLSLLSGLAGGVASRELFPSPYQPTSREVHLDDGSSQCDLTSRGLRVRRPDGQEIEIGYGALVIRGGRHRITLAASDLKEIDASYLVMDGRVWSAPSNRDKVSLLTGLAAVGEIDIKQIESPQPK